MIHLLFSYQHNMDPYLRIGPFKIEELNEEPIVLMFHDFLPNVETDEIISRASTKLFMSQTGFAEEASQNTQLRLVYFLAPLKQSTIERPGINDFFLNRISKQTWMSGQVYAAFNETMPESLKKRKIHNHLNTIDKDSIYNIKVINMLSEKFVLSKINKRIEIATKLKTIGPHASENYQVANYGIGTYLVLTYLTLQK